MAEKEKQKKQKSANHKKQKNQHPNKDHQPTSKSGGALDLSFKPSLEVKGLRFGGQFVIKSFTIRRARPIELLKLLSYPLPPPSADKKPPKSPFPSTIAFLPTNFTILAHHAWHTLTLGLGTKKSKVVVGWPAEIPLGEVNKKLIRGVKGCEMARFKFRKGCITFYVYAVRKEGNLGFGGGGEELRVILQSVASLNDFLDHTAMLAMPNQRSINYAAAAASAAPQPVAMAH
ncbi:hypothetical protein LINPERHAP1_LOCUS2923 [Linum perenne]